MTNHLDAAIKTLLQPANLTESHLQTLMGKLLGGQIDSADLYFQDTQYESWAIENGIVKEGSFDIERGVGVRAVSGEKVGYASSDELLFPALESAVSAAKSIAKSNEDQAIQLAKPSIARALYTDKNPLNVISDIDKIQFLQAIDKAARKEDPRVKQVMASLSGAHETILMMHSSGRLIADIRPLVRVNVTVIVEENGRREQGFSGGGGRYTYEELIAEHPIEKHAKEAVRQALVNLEAIPAPAGAMPVVLGPGWPGVLLHEAIGHGLEGDFNRKGSSAFSGRIGERVASPLCTIVDDGTLPNRRGSLNVDDEGVETQCTTLIENGILKSYMQDELNAKLMGVQSTGNGRRESYGHKPMPRMTNTYMLAGQHEHEEIIASVEKGIYAANFGGGQVDITSGKFVFSTSEAYLIENGKITAPIKGATLIGNGPDVLTKVSMVGNNLELDEGVGICGKDGQSVPVGVGQPSLKVDELIVGGTQ
jgi:TldD protein